MRMLWEIVLHSILFLGKTQGVPIKQMVLAYTARNRDGK
jgi:hypothetical protein